MRYLHVYIYLVSAEEPKPLSCFRSHHQSSTTGSHHTPTTPHRHTLTQQHKRQSNSTHMPRSPKSSSSTRWSMPSFMSSSGKQTPTKPSRRLAIAPQGEGSDNKGETDPIAWSVCVFPQNSLSPAQLNCSSCTRDTRFVVGSGVDEPVSRRMYHQRFFAVSLLWRTRYQVCVCCKLLLHEKCV